MTKLFRKALRMCRFKSWALFGRREYQSFLMQFMMRNPSATQVLDGVYTLRFCVGNSRTEREHVLAAWDVINQEAEKLLKGSA